MNVNNMHNSNDRKIDIFKCLVLSSTLDVDNKELIINFNFLKLKNKGRILSNKGGWQSNNLDLKDKKLNPLVEKIIEKSIQYMKLSLFKDNDFKLLNLWANINSYKDFNENHFKQISLKNNIIKPDYKGANIISFLSFLNNTICIPQNLRIVCHSHIMQKIIKDLNITPNNNIKSILKENLWSIFMSLNNGKKISISRHGFSFANLIKEKKTLLGKIEQHLEKDAKLSLYGILTALLHGSDLVEKELSYGMTEKPQTIFVSTLIRTWMTAICLYLPHCDNDNFTLVVSPFIKEKGTELDNIPDSFENQIKTMQKFLKYLIKISDLKFSNAIINENLLKIKNYFIVKRFNLIVYARYPATIMYGEKMIEVEFHYRDKLGLSYFHNISKNENYFNKYCLQYKTI